MQRDRDDGHERGERGWTPPPRAYASELARETEDPPAP
jgi:hypothetical protein